MKVKIYHSRDTKDPGGRQGINSAALPSLPSAVRPGSADLPPLSAPASARIVSGKANWSHLHPAREEQMCWLGSKALSERGYLKVK